MHMDDDSEEIKEHFDVESWLEDEGVTFKKGRGSSGMQLNLAECPSCGDRRYRTYINAETGLGNCFVCNIGLNKSKMVMLLNGVGYGPSLKIMKDYNAKMGYRPRKKVEIAVEMNCEIRLPVSTALPTPEGQNLQYLEDRGFSGEIAKYFHLRYCQHGWWMFKKDDGSQGAQDFSNRVIVPVFDLDGMLKTFQGRDIGGTSDAKYLFPKGLPGTGRFLLNGHSVMKAKRVVMGEGIFDIAAIKVAFDQDPVLKSVVPIGSFGKHLSYGDMNGNDQLGRFVQLRRDGLEEVTIMWDGGEKELVAALNAAELLRKLGLRVRVATLPPGKDPNEIAPEQVRECFHKAETYSHALAVRWRLRNPYKK
jgi:DNA primase